MTPILKAYDELYPELTDAECDEIVCKVWDCSPSAVQREDREQVRAGYTLGLSRARLSPKVSTQTQSVPKEPSRGLLVSMAMRLNHGFGLNSPAWRESQITQMRQVYEEVAGTGFYRPECEAKYVAAAPTPCIGFVNGCHCQDCMPNFPENDQPVDWSRRRGGSFDPTPAKCSTETVQEPPAAPAPGVGALPVRRFACFTMEDGVYESATGEHVSYSDYAATIAALAQMRDENADLHEIHKEKNRQLDRAQADVARLTQELAKERKQNGLLALDLARERSRAKK